MSNNPDCIQPISRDDFRLEKLNFIANLIRYNGTTCTCGYMKLDVNMTDFLGTNLPEAVVAIEDQSHKAVNVIVSDLMAYRLELRPVTGVHVIAYECVNKNYVDIRLSDLDDENLDLIIRTIV